MERANRGRKAVADGLCVRLGLTANELATAEFESRFNYIERDKVDPRTGKKRHVCYPPEGSMLHRAQVAIKDCVLRELPISSYVLGYRKGTNHITVASLILAARYCGTLDISRFHPSIRRGHVMAALRRLGVTWSWSRRISRLVTFHDRVPVGAPSSNDVANCIMHMLLQRKVAPTTERLRVGLVNYGDDIAFWGPDRNAVGACVTLAENEITRLGFEVNDKGRLAEHCGGTRRFLGCANGRNRLDIPRSKFRKLRRELRVARRAESHRLGREPITAPGNLLSFRQRIRYVEILNRRKARKLLDELFRLCAARGEPLGQRERSL